MLNDINPWKTQLTVTTLHPGRNSVDTIIFVVLESLSQKEKTGWQQING